MSMGNNNRWLKTRKRHQILIAKIQRIAGGSLIAALIVGPLIYFSVVAMPLEMRDDSRQAPSQEIAKDVPPTGEIGIASAPELRISSTPIPLPEEDLREAKILAKSEKKDLKLEPVSAKFEVIVPETIESIGGNLPEAEEVKFESFFGKQDAQIKKIKIGEGLPQTEPVYGPELEVPSPEIVIPQLASEEANKNRENNILIIDDLTLEDGPAKINKKDDAEKTAEKALQKYLRSEFKSADFRIFKDTSILDKNKKPYQFVLSTVKQNNGKWYVTYQQYSNALPVFDGDLKLIFTDEKKLLTISDNIKRDLPDESEFVIGKAVVTESVKEIFEWDDTIDEIEFIDKGYFEGQPAYRASTNAHDPLGEWEIYVDGVEGNIESLTANIRLQDVPSTPQVDYSSTPEPFTGGTDEPEIEILDALFSQILGTIYQQTPSDPITTEPLSSAYTYINTAQHETDFQGYFENASMEWYSTFLDGPNVTIHDDDATSNMEIVNQTPEAPFIWDENSASLAAINAFYHTNKIHDYFVNNHGYEVGKNVPLTVNSTLVDAYIDGCGAWFNNTEKTIEMGRGGTASCPAELNYALGSDMVYHEYTHFIVEDITHLPNILGSESAAMGEAFADYFAASINDDPMWGDVISPARRRNLENTLNYNNDMLGESHHDGMILSGTLWDLRTEIGAEATDQLVFNTLFQDRYHYETFMYGMIIEDDDNDDFSDGTPHLAEIIIAFDNHGIGPGIAGFNGLPLTPEAWAELLGEEIPEGEEEELIGSYTGVGCSVSGSNLTVTGGACIVYNTQTFWDVTVNSDGTLYVGYSGYSTTTNTLYIDDDLYVAAGGKVFIGAAGLGYNSQIRFTNTSTPYMTIYGLVEVREDDTAYNNIIGSTTSTRPYIFVYNSTGFLNLYDYSGSYGQYLYVSNGGTVNIGGSGFCWPQPCTTPRFDGYLDISGNSYFRGGTNLNVAVNSLATTSYFRTDSLRISDSTYSASTVVNDGQIYIDNGDFEIGNSSTIDSSYRFFHYSGHSATINGSSTITNTSTNPTYNMEFDSPISMNGTLTTITNDGGDIDLDTSVVLNDSSRIWNDNGGSVSIADGVIMYNTSSLLNDPSGTFSIGNAAGEGLTMRAATTVYNDASFTVYDDIIMANEVSGATATFNNDGTLTVIGSADNTIQITQDCTVNNGIGNTIEVSTGAVSSSDGVIQVFDTADLDNQGTINATQIQVGNGLSVGGYFYNKSGATTVIKDVGNALLIYRGWAENFSGATQFSMSNSGYINVSGISGDPGTFRDRANSSGRILLDGYADMQIYTGATHTSAGICGLEEADDGRDGHLTVDSGGTLDCATTNLGSTSQSPGIIDLYGDLTGTTLNIFEDATPGSLADDEYELNVYTSGFVDVTTINLGDATHSGGELLNRAGDGIKYGTDTSDEGVRGITYVYGGGNVYNGGDRSAGLLNSNAEYNYETTPSRSLQFLANSRVNNHGYFGGGGILTDLATGGPKRFYNYDTGKVIANEIWIFNSGIFYNGGTTTHNANVNAPTRILLGGTGVYNNYGDTTTLKLEIGNITYPGGILNLEDGGDFAVTSTAVDAAIIYYSGLINAMANHNTFTAAGQTNVYSTTGTNAVINIEDGTGTPTFNDLVVSANGQVLIDEGLNLNGALTIAGAVGEEGLVRIQNDLSQTQTLYVDTTTLIQAYGRLTNNSHFTANEGATVEANGNIDSDESSDFSFYEDLTTAGTVEIADDAGFDSGIIVTGGSTLLGSTTGYGGGVIGTALIDVSGGAIFTAHSDVSTWGNVDIDGATTTAYFNDDDLASNCETNIHGYFDITSGATATINCETIPAVDVYSGSPGGNTQVEGTLIINTNLETETMVVGDGVSASGTVTHDLADDTWNAAETFILTISDSLTINSNGEFDVSSKSEVGPNHTAASEAFLDGRAGSYGGRGQHDTSILNAEYGYAKAYELNYDAQTANFTIGAILTGGTSGATAKIMNDDDNVTTGTLTINILSGYFQTNEIITDSVTGSATSNGLPHRTDFGQYGISDTYVVQGDKTKLYDGGYGGGTMTITVGTDTDSDGIMDSGTIDIKSSGKIWSNGQDFADGAGSGGSVDIYTNKLLGGGTIMAVGGSSGSALGDKTAGGGGRVRIEYVDKNSFTGTVRAYGGANTDGYYAGTGTIFYKWEDQWQNQNDGTLVVDAFMTSDVIDVDLDGVTLHNEILANKEDDATITTESLDVESIQIDRYAGFHHEHGYTEVISPQQCLEANGGKFYIDTITLKYNRDHGPSSSSSCIFAPDPPHTLYANNSTTGAQTNLATTDFTLNYYAQTANFNVGATLTGGTSGATGIIMIDTDNVATGTLRLVDIAGTFQADEIITDNGTIPGSATSNGSLAAPVVNDNTPAFSSIHNDAELDRVPGGDEDTDGAGRYQLQIAPAMEDLWNDTTGNYICDLDLQSMSSILDDARIADIVTNSTTCAVSANTTYYWRMRYEDLDATLKTWGLWSETGQFDTGDYMEISNSCSSAIDIKDTNAGGLGIVGASLQNHDADRYGNASCGITITSSAAGWQVLYGMSVGETDFKDTSSHAWSPIDNTGGDRTIDTTGNTEEEEYGFNINNISGSLTGKIQLDPTAGQYYNNWSQVTGDYLFDIAANGSENTIIKDLAAGITNATFDLFLHASLDRFTYKSTYDLDTDITITTTP